jgi:hypothetical protein
VNNINLSENPTESSVQNCQQHSSPSQSTNTLPVTATTTNGLIKNQNIINNVTSACQSSQPLTNNAAESSKKRKRRSQQDSPPTRNLSAYMFFANVHRPWVMKLYPESTCPDITKILATLWKEAPFEEKKVFTISICFEKKENSFEFESFYRFTKNWLKKIKSDIAMKNASTICSLIQTFRKNPEKKE